MSKSNFKLVVDTFNMNCVNISKLQISHKFKRSN